MMYDMNIKKKRKVALMKNYMKKTMVILLTGLLLVHTRGNNYSPTNTSTTASRIENFSNKGHIELYKAGDTENDHTYY